MPAPPLDLNNCLFGLYPYQVGKPAIHPFDSNDFVRYAKAVLRCKTGHALAKNNVFDGAMYWAVRDMEALFGRPIDGHISGGDWNCVDYLATH
jgi:hypothetical protein